MGSFDDGGYDLCTSEPYHFTSHSNCLVYSFGSGCFSLLLFLSLCVFFFVGLLVSLIYVNKVEFFVCCFFVFANHQLKSVLHVDVSMATKEFNVD